MYNTVLYLVYNIILHLFEILTKLTYYVIYNHNSIQVDIIHII